MLKFAKALPLLKFAPSHFRSLRWNQPLTVEVETDACAGTKNEIRYLEHVQMILTLEYSRRGDLTIILTTPMGTKTVLLPTRSEDSSDEGFKRWPFMTTHAWGEDPRGKWTLEIRDAGDARANTGTLRDWQLVLFGTKQKPGVQKVSHPDIPLHRKAVPDDTKTVQGNQQPSVTITKVTYTFGSQPISQTQPSSQLIPAQSIPQALPDLPTIAPLNNEFSKSNSQNSNTPPHIIDNLLASSVSQLSRFQDQRFPQGGQNFGSLGVAQPSSFPSSNYNSNPFPYVQTRSSIPYAASYMKHFNPRNYQSQSITNYYLHQGQHIRSGPQPRPSYMYKSYKSWPQAPGVRMDARGFWDYFGRNFRKRALPHPNGKSEQERNKKSNSLIRTVKKSKHGT